MCVVKKAIFHINVQIERILIQKRKRVVIIHLKKIRRRRIKIKRRIKTRRSHTLFSPFKNLFLVSGGVYIERIFRKSLSRDSEKNESIFTLRWSVGQIYYYIW